MRPENVIFIPRQDAPSSRDSLQIALTPHRIHAPVFDLYMNRWKTDNIGNIMVSSASRKGLEEIKRLRVEIDRRTEALRASLKYVLLPGTQRYVTSQIREVRRVKCFWNPSRCCQSVAFRRHHTYHWSLVTLSGRSRPFYVYVKGKKLKKENWHAWKRNSFNQITPDRRNLKTVFSLWKVPH